MADKDPRPGILGTISDWLKLLGLIVLVAEAVILAAMAMTPAGNAMAPYYPVFMLAFLIVIVVGVFFDRYLALHNTQNELSMQIGDKTLSVPGKQRDVVSPPTGSQPETLYVDSLRGFRIELPKSAGWSRPEVLDFGEYLLHVGLLSEREEFATLKEVLSIQPLGRMMAEASVMFVTQGGSIEAEVTDTTTTDALEAVLARTVQVTESLSDEKITDEQVAALRKEILAKKTLRSKFPVQNTFSVLILEKSLAAASLIAPTLANLFIQNISQTGGTVDNLVADERTILYGNSQTWRNVLVAGKQGELTMYAVNQLTQSDRFIYVIGITFSPQTQKSLEVWSELQRMMQSFRMLAN